MSIETSNFDKVNVKFSVDRLQQFYPNEYRNFFTKVYRNAEIFHDYRLHLYLKALAHIGLTMPEKSFFSDVETLTAQFMLEFDNPTFFVAKDLLNAMMQTDMKTRLKVNDLYLPFLAFTLMFPKNYLKVGNEEICYCDIIKIVGEHLGKETIGIRFNFVTDTGRLIFKTVGDGFEFTGYYFTSKQVTDDPYYLELSDNENNVANQIIQAICNLLLVVNSRPEYLEHGNRSGYHKKQKTEIWTPNVIGMNYRIRYKKKESTTTNIKVRLHWRRGHTRLQHYGVGNLLSKTIWIEPMLIGVDK